MYLLRSVYNVCIATEADVSAVAVVRRASLTVVAVHCARHRRIKDHIYIYT